VIAPAHAERACAGDADLSADVRKKHPGLWVRSHEFRNLTRTAPTMPTTPRNAEFKSDYADREYGRVTHSSHGLERFEGFDEGFPLRCEVLIVMLRVRPTPAGVLWLCVCRSSRALFALLGNGEVPLRKRQLLCDSDGGVGLLSDDAIRKAHRTGK